MNRVSTATVSEEWRVAVDETLGMAGRSGQPADNIPAALRLTFPRGHSAYVTVVGPHNYVILLQIIPE